jgi:hypothetical protein
VLAHVTASIFDEDCLVHQRGKLCHFVNWAQCTRPVFNGIVAYIILLCNDLSVDRVGHYQRLNHQWLEVL